MRLSPIHKFKDIGIKDFLSTYMKPLQPVILQDFIGPKSPAFNKWNYDYFKEIAGDHKVNIYGSEINSLDCLASQPIGQSTFTEYLNLITSSPTAHRLFLFNLLNFKPELKNDLYYNDITGGKIIKWLPFMFFGGEGSVTRNHIDIDMSHIFITQFQGIKRIWLFPREQSDLLYKLPYNFHSIANIKEPDYKKFPALKYLNGYEAIIKPGETLYIPSGWWHYIQYEKEGYSVSTRALPSRFTEKWRGFRNLILIRNFDNAMRKIFKDQWFNFKVRQATKKANRAIKRHEKSSI